MEKLEIFHNLVKRIKDGIAGSTVEVSDRVVARLQEAEISKRTEKLLAGYNALELAEKNLKKLNQPDVFTYGLDKNKIPGFSQARIKEEKQVREHFDQLSTAFAEAASTGDFEKLDKAMQKKIVEVKNPENVGE